jgi:hypothetical protein
MAESSSDDPELTRALQAVAQNLLNPAFQVGEINKEARWVWHQTVCDFANSDHFLSKRKRPPDPEDKENESSDNMSKNYCSFGRIYSRQASPFNTVDSVVNFGIKHEASDDDDSDNEPKTLTTQ